METNNSPLFHPRYCSSQPAVSRAVWLESRARVKMSKNTASDKFRKVNVEDFDEDAYKEDEADAPGGNDDNLVAQKEAEVKKLTQSYPYHLVVYYKSCYVYFFNSFIREITWMH